MPWRLDVHLDHYDVLHLPDVFSCVCSACEQVADDMRAKRASQCAHRTRCVDKERTSKRMHISACVGLHLRGLTNCSGGCAQQARPAV